MTRAEALAFLGTHGVVLESGAGPVPSLAAAIAGQPIRGSWWAHARGREIFSATRALRESPDVLVCRLVAGKVTFVHRRLWPALVRLAGRFSPTQLAPLREVHAATGKHRVITSSFAAWVTPELAAQAAALDESGAVQLLGPWCPREAPGRNRRDAGADLAEAP